MPKKKNTDFYLNWVAQNFLITSDQASKLPKEFLDLDFDSDEDLIFQMVHLAYIQKQQKATGNPDSLTITEDELMEAISIGYQRFMVHLGFFELIQKGFLVLDKPIYLFTFDLDTDFVIKHFERYPEGILPKEK
jgi:hypothetical protein